MTNEEILDAIANGIREPNAKRTSRASLQSAIDNGVTILGQTIAKACPEYFNKRKSISSNTNVFPFPSDLIRETRIQNLGTNAISVAGTADNGSGLVRIETETSHEFTDGTIVFVHDVGGTTEANGPGKISLVDDTHFDLMGSAYSSGYTSGGKVFAESKNFKPITRIPANQSEWRNKDRWFLRNESFVIDSFEFQNDILVDYYYFPNSLEDIPARFHYGLAAFGIITIIKLPPEDAPGFTDFQISLEINRGLWRTCMDQAKNFTLTSEQKNVNFPRKTKRNKGGYI